MCSRLPDADHDGIPNTCDNCLNAPNADQLNSNNAVEYSLHAVQLGDLCDPVPIAPYKHDPVTYATTPGVPPLFSSPTNGVDYETLRLSSWLGTAANMTNTQFFQNTGFAHCSCFIPGTSTEISMEECTNGQCLPSNARLSTAGWKPMTLSTNAGMAIPSSAVSLNFKVGTALGGPVVRWESASDLRNARVDGYSRSTYGLVASVVSRGDGVVYASSRDSAMALRVVLDMMRTPSAQFKDRRFIEACVIGGCWGWVRPWEKLWNPADRYINPGDIRGIVRGAMVLEPDLNFGSYIGTNGEFAAYANLVSDELKDALASGKWAWIPFAERSSEIESRALDVQGVLVPRVGTLGRPRRIGIRDGILDIVDEQTDKEYQGVLSVGGRAAYSAVQNTLFVADQSLGQGLFFYDMSTGIRWQNSEVDNAEMGPVDGLVLDTDANRLFVLQRNKEGDRESLTMRDLATGERRDLLSLPVTGKMETVALALDSTGAVVLAAGDTRSFSLWRYVFNGESLTFTGRYAQDGRLGAEPLSVDFTVPVINDDGSTVLARPAVADFKDPTPCSSL